MVHPNTYHHLFPSHLLFPYNLVPQNHVHWSETPESHIFSADIPGARKEGIKVEVEGSRYIIIRTEAVDESTEPARPFMRKFRLPGMVDVDRISAKYEDGVLTVSVPIFSREEVSILTQLMCLNTLILLPELLSQWRKDL